MRVDHRSHGRTTRAPVACGLDPFEYGRVGQVLADPVELAGPVVVARPRGEEAELGGEPAQVLALGGLVVAMLDLDAGQAGGGQPRDDAVRHDPAPAGREGVGHHRHTARAADQADGELGVGRVVAHVVAGPAAQDGREGLVAVRHEPELDHRIGDVGPAHGRAGLHPARDVRPGDRMVRGDQVDHAPGPGQPIGSGALHLGGQRRIRRVGQVGEDVHADAARLGRELEAGHEQHARRDGRPRGLRPAGGGVVVGQCEAVEPRRQCVGHDGRRRLGAVGGRGVNVEIEAHVVTLEAATDAPAAAGGASQVRRMGPVGRVSARRRLSRASGSERGAGSARELRAEPGRQRGVRDLEDVVGVADVPQLELLEQHGRGRAGPRDRPQPHAGGLTHERGRPVDLDRPERGVVPRGDELEVRRTGGDAVTGVEAAEAREVRPEPDAGLLGHEQEVGGEVVDVDGERVRA